MILPKKDKDGRYYLSYSQIAAYLRSKKDYIRKYFFNERQDFQDYLIFGKRVGDAIQHGDYSAFTKAEQITLKKVPRLTHFEKPINVDFGSFYIKGYLDSCSQDLSHIIDYKTGTMDKEEEYVKEDYIQLLIYAMGIKQECGKTPKKIEVVLIERLGNPFKREPLKVGKKIKRINLEISKERINFAKDLVIKTAKEISRHYQVYLKLNK